MPPEPAVCSISKRLALARVLVKVSVSTLFSETGGTSLDGCWEKAEGVPARRASMAVARCGFIETLRERCPWRPNAAEGGEVADAPLLPSGEG